MRKHQPLWAAARRSRRGSLPAGTTLMRLSDRLDSYVIRACNLFILDKGKPVARPGRKAKGRRIVSGGSLAAEGVITIISASDGEEVLFLLDWGPEGEPQAGAGSKRAGASPDGTR